MKVLLFTISILCFSNNYSQNKIAEIIFKDGTSIKGLGKLKSNGEVKFRIDKKSEKLVYQLDSLQSVIIDYREYVKLKIADTEKSKILEPMIKGKVSLYHKTSFLGGGTMQTPSGTLGTGGSGIINYYLIKEGEKAAFHVGTNYPFSKNFKEAAINYFKDCQELVSKIENEEFTKYDLRKIIYYYNKNCN